MYTSTLRTCENDSLGRCLQITRYRWGGGTEKCLFDTVVGHDQSYPPPPVSTYHQITRTRTRQQNKPLTQTQSEQRRNDAE